MMNRTVSPEARDLARRLLSFEVSTDEVPNGDVPAVFIVSEKLRRPLSTLVGTVGFRSLLVRALTLARREAKVLCAVQVKEDGSLEGLNGDATHAGDVLIAHLIGLLETFIGEPLTLRLVKDAWPDLPGPALSSNGEESI
jgi:hypothetical protein